MSFTPPSSVKFNVQDLIRAIALDTVYDAFNPTLTTTQWDVLGGYLQPFALGQGQVLIEQGAQDRSEGGPVGELRVRLPDDGDVAEGVRRLAMRPLRTDEPPLLHVPQVVLAQMRVTLEQLPPRDRRCAGRRHEAFNIIQS